MPKKSRSKDRSRGKVPFKATPPREPPSIAEWAHHAVWNERMLTTLKVGVRGGKWHTLIDKVYSEKNLFFSARKVTGKKGAAGVDRQTVEDFDQQHWEEIRQLQQSLRDGTYQPAAVRRTWIDKPGSKDKRPLGIPTVRDRVVQTALVHVIEPILDATFHERSFGFRHGRSCHDALRVVEELLAAGYVYVVDADLKSYFDTIPKDRLQALVAQQISDRRVLALVRSYLDQSIMEALKTWTPEEGVPQGAVLSPVLANLYLSDLDHTMANSGYQMVRYADDFVILCRSQEEAEAALEQVRQWVTAHGLTLHPDKTHIVNNRDTSFSFLGYTFRGSFRYPRDKSQAKLTDHIRELTPRKSGSSLDHTITRLNRVLVGWFHYFRHCNKTIFEMYDGYTRRRLRRILAKRNRRNPKRLPDNQRWPNAYFRELGLYSLEEAFHQFVRSITDPLPGEPDAGKPPVRF